MQTSKGTEIKNATGMTEGAWRGVVLFGEICADSDMHMFCTRVPGTGYAGTWYAFEYYYSGTDLHPNCLSTTILYQRSLADTSMVYKL